MKINLEIMGGMHDDELDAIAEAVAFRRKALQPHHSVYEFNVGDKVRFRDNARPKYIQGVEATITGYHRTKVTLTFDRTQGRFRAGATVTAPVSILEKV